MYSGSFRVTAQLASIFTLLSDPVKRLPSMERSNTSLLTNWVPISLPAPNLPKHSIINHNESNRLRSCSTSHCICGGKHSFRYDARCRNCSTCFCEKLCRIGSYRRLSCQFRWPLSRVPMLGLRRCSCPWMQLPKLHTGTSPRMPMWRLHY